MKTFHPSRFLFSLSAFLAFIGLLCLAVFPVYSQDALLTPIDPSNADQLHVCTSLETEFAVGGLVWLADSSGLIVGGETSLWKFDIANPKQPIQIFAHPVVHLALSKDGKWLVGNGVEAVYVWDTEDEFALTTLNIQYAEKLWLSHDGSLLVYNLSSRDNDFWQKSIVVWDVDANKEVKRFEFESPVSSFVVDEAANRIFSAHANGVILVRDWDTGEQIYEQDEYGRSITEVELSSDTTMLAYGGYRRMIHIWHMKEGEIITVPLLYLFDTLAFSPNNSLLASTSVLENTISIRNTTDGIELSDLKSHENFVFALAFSPDGTMLASVDFDDALKLWGVDC